MTNTYTQELRAQFTQHLAIDFRSLTLFRIGIAGVLLLDLADRARNIREHYSDGGALPRSVYTKIYDQGDFGFSLHLSSGSVLFQSLLFCVAGICALCLLVGYRTWAATLISWLLLSSLHARNPLVLYGADVVLKQMLFWSLFLPLGRKYSLDWICRGKPAVPVHHADFGTAGLLLQIAFIYIFTGLMKTDPCWRVDGTAVSLSLNIYFFATPFGYYLLGFPLLLKVLTFGTIIGEAIGPLIALLSSGAARTVTVFGFMAFHVGLWLCLSLGLFPLICIVAWTAFLPSWFWNRVTKAISVKELYPLNALISYNSASASSCFCARLLRFPFRLPFRFPFLAEENRLEAFSQVSCENKHFSHNLFQGAVHLMRATLQRVLPYQSNASQTHINLHRLQPTKDLLRLVTESLLQPRPTHLWTLLCPLRNFLAVFSIVYIFCWNVRTLDEDTFQEIIPPHLEWFGEATNVGQRWNLFAPYPFSSNGWFVIPAKLVNGQSIDLARDGRPVNWSRPRYASDLYHSIRVRKFMMNLRQSENQDLLPYYAQFLYRQWNNGHVGNEQIMALDICYMLDSDLPTASSRSPQKIVLWSQNP